MRLGISFGTDASLVAMHRNSGRVALFLQRSDDGRLGGRRSGGVDTFPAVDSVGRVCGREGN